MGGVGGVSVVSPPVPQQTTVDEDALMVRFGKNDAEAFDALYDRYERPIYSFCLRLLGDPDSAADAFQDVFMRVVDARNRYEPRGRFASWIFTITRRVCLDRLRTARRYEPLDRHLALTNDGDIDAATRVAANDTIDRLLAHLPIEQREVLVLNRYHGFTYREIARMLDSTEAAVKQKAYRAVETLRKARGGKA